MFRPRDSHDLRVLATDLQVIPPAQDIRLIQDVYSNSVALVQPQSPASELTFECTFTVEHTGSRALDLPLSREAETYPFQYSLEDSIALQHYLQPYYQDGQDELLGWAQQFIQSEGEGPTASRDPLVNMTRAIKDSMTYIPRYEEGVQTPQQTLALGSGTCRDFATLMIEAVRLLGYAARFVTGYVYCTALDSTVTTVDDNGVASTTTSTVGAGATHAWVQVYLPGAGWMPFDPTNNLIGGTDLIRVGVARHASLAQPLGGSWHGAGNDYLGMTVDVQVHKRA